MTPVALWNALRRKNEKKLWTPIWNWTGFNDDFYRISVKEVLRESVKNLAEDDFGSMGRMEKEELDAVCALFLVYCAMEGGRDSDDYLRSLGLELGDVPKTVWENGKEISARDPYAGIRRLPLKMVQRAETMLGRYDLSSFADNQGNQLKCRILWESPLVLDARKRGYMLQVWSSMGYAESCMDEIFEDVSANWVDCGDTYSFYLQCVVLLNAARKSYEKHGVVLPEEVAPQIAGLVDDLNGTDAVFKQVRAARFLSTRGEWHLFTRCENPGNMAVMARRGYGEKFPVADERLDFDLKLYAGEGPRKKILGRLPLDLWFFESSDEEGLFRMVPRRVDFDDYRYPLYVIASPFGSMNQNLQASEEYLVEPESSEVHFMKKKVFRFDTAEDFESAFIRDIPMTPVIFRPAQELHARYRAPNGQWESISYVSRGWPGVPQSQAYASMLWLVGNRFEVANLDAACAGFTVRTFKLNTDCSNGVRILVLPAGFGYREICDEGEVVGINFFKDGNPKFLPIEPEILDNNIATARFTTEEGGELELTIAVQYRRENDESIKDTRNGKDLASLRELLQMGERPTESHVLRVLSNGGNIYDIAALGLEIPQKILEERMPVDLECLKFALDQGLCKDAATQIKMLKTYGVEVLFLFKEKIGNVASAQVYNQAISMDPKICAKLIDVPDLNREILNYCLTRKELFWERSDIAESLKKKAVENDGNMVFYMENPSRELIDIAYEQDPSLFEYEYRDEKDQLFMLVPFIGRDCTTVNKVLLPSSKINEIVTRKPRTIRFFPNASEELQKKVLEATDAQFIRFMNNPCQELVESFAKKLRWDSFVTDGSRPNGLLVKVPLEIKGEETIRALPMSEDFLAEMCYDNFHLLNAVANPSKSLKKKIRDREQASRELRKAYRQKEVDSQKNDVNQKKNVYATTYADVWLLRRASPEHQFNAIRENIRNARYVPTLTDEMVDYIIRKMADSGSDEFNLSNYGIDDNLKLMIPGESDPNREFILSEDQLVYVLSKRPYLIRLIKWPAEKTMIAVVKNNPRSSRYMEPLYPGVVREMIASGWPVEKDDQGRVIRIPYEGRDGVEMMRTFPVEGGGSLIVGARVSNVKFGAGTITRITPDQIFVKFDNPSVGEKLLKKDIVLKNKILKFL